MATYGDIMVNILNSKLAAVVFGCGCTLVLASCTSEKKTEPSSSMAAAGGRTVTVQPGEAGGVVEDSYSVSATVTSLDRATRQVTLTAGDGSRTKFIAGQEIRNLDQLHEGDKVTATISERLVIFVRTDGEDPSVTHASALVTAPKGAKPGAMAAEKYEVVAKVKSIDTANRIAVLQFTDGDTRKVKVRPDVDLSKYKVGDSVVIRVTAMLSVLAESQ